MGTEQSESWARRTWRTRAGTALTLTFVGVLALGVAFGATRAAHAAPYTVCPSGCTYTSINAAVTAASAGDTITVGPGTYGQSTGDSQIPLTKPVSLQGAGNGQTILQGLNTSAGHGVISIYHPGSANTGAYTINGFTIEGTGSHGNSEPLLMGVWDHNLTDTINVQNDTFYADSTLDPAIATDDVFAFFSYGSTATFNLTGNTFQGMWQAILFEDSPSVVNITSNTFTGLVSSGGLMAEGMLLLADSGYVVSQTQTISNNTFTKYAGLGVAIEGGYQSANLTGTMSSGVISGNTFDQQGAITGSGVVSADIKLVGADNSQHATPAPNGIVSGMTIENNLMNVTSPGVGIAVAGSVGTGNTIKNNLLRGTGSTLPAAGINLAATAGTPVLDITSNEIEDFNTGISELSGAVDTVNAAGTGTSDGNCIQANGAYGVNNAGTAPINAVNNWWGTASGPNAADNASGTGNKVSVGVTEKPFLTAPAEICAGPMASLVAVTVAGSGASVSASVALDATQTADGLMLGGALYNVNGGSYVPMTGTFGGASASVTASATSFPSGGTVVVCVEGTDSFGNVGPASCLTKTLSGTGLSGVAAAPAAPSVAQAPAGAPASNASQMNTSGPDLPHAPAASAQVTVPTVRSSAPAVPGALYVLLGVLLFGLLGGGMALVVRRRVASRR